MTFTKFFTSLFLVLIPFAASAQKKQSQPFDAQNIYWVAVNDSLESSVIDKCDNLVRINEDKLAMTFTRTDSAGYQAMVLLPPKSKAWDNPQLFDEFHRLNGKISKLKLKGAKKDGKKITIKYEQPNGQEQELEYVQSKTENGRYLTSAKPGNGALNQAIDTYQKDGKPGMFHLRCRGPLTPIVKSDSSASLQSSNPASAQQVQPTSQVNATVMFACIDSHSAGRDRSLAETLIQNLVEGCDQCYASLITNPSVSTICSDSGVPMRNTRNMDKWEMVGQKNGIKYYLYKSSQNATMGIIAR